MEIKTIRFDEETAKNCLPELVAGNVSYDDCYCFGAFDGEALVGFAVCRPSMTMEREVSLLYVEVQPAYRRKGIAKSLVAYVEKAAIAAGARLMSVKYVDSADNLREASIFLRKLRYIPISMNTRYCVYYLQDLQDTLFARKIPEMEALTDKVKNYNDLNKVQIIELTEKLKKLGNGTALHFSDLVFARYFVLNEKIEGFMNLAEIAPDILLMSDSYIDNQAKTALILPAMIASALKVCFPLLGDAASVSLEIASETGYRGIKDIFGEAERDLFIHEYVKKL